MLCLDNDPLSSAKTKIKQQKLSKKNKGNNCTLLNKKANLKGLHIVWFQLKTMDDTDKSDQTPGEE